MSIDSIPLSEVKSIDQFEEAMNANHHAEEADSARNQSQSSLPKIKPSVRTEYKQGSNPEAIIESDNSGLAGTVAGGPEIIARLLNPKVMQIKTDCDGHNSGRTYYIKANVSDDIGQIISRLSSLAKSARKSAENKSKFERQQLEVRRIYNSPPFQYFTAALIFGVCCGDEFEHEFQFYIRFSCPEFLPLVSTRTSSQMRRKRSSTERSKTPMAIKRQRR